MNVKKLPTVHKNLCEKNFIFKVKKVFFYLIGFYQQDSKRSGLKKKIKQILKHDEGGGLPALSLWNSGGNCLLVKEG